MTSNVNFFEIELKNMQNYVYIQLEITKFPDIVLQQPYLCIQQGNLPQIFDTHTNGTYIEAIKCSHTRNLKQKMVQIELKKIDLKYQDDYQQNNKFYISMLSQGNGSFDFKINNWQNNLQECLNQCNNQGQCVENFQNNLNCICDEGYRGDDCQIQSLEIKDKSEIKNIEILPLQYVFFHINIKEKKTNFRFQIESDIESNFTIYVKQSELQDTDFAYQRQNEHVFNFDYLDNISQKYDDKTKLTPLHLTLKKFDQQKNIEYKQFLISIFNENFNSINCNITLTNVDLENKNYEKSVEVFNFMQNYVLKIVLYINGVIFGIIGIFSCKQLKQEIKKRKQQKAYNNIFDEVIQNIQIDEKSSQILEDEECSICLNFYEQREFIRILTCKHFFHEKCLQDWIKQKHQCPNCREDISIIKLLKLSEKYVKQKGKKQNKKEILQELVDSIIKRRQQDEQEQQMNVLQDNQQQLQDNNEIDIQENNEEVSENSGNYNNDDRQIDLNIDSEFHIQQNQNTDIINYTDMSNNQIITCNDDNSKNVTQQQLNYSYGDVFE